MKNDSISLGRRVKICIRMLRIAWQVRAAAVTGYFIGAAIEISGMLLSIYATAKLSSLLAHFVSTGQTSSIWFWLWADIVSFALTGLGFLAMSYAKRMVYFSLVR